jgi:Fe2+ or Zn2+ uptake regulation protein
MSIVECLLDGKHLHSAEDIVNHLRTKSKKIVNLKTVYNTIDFLESNNLIEKHIVGRKIFYEVTETKGNHIHVIDQDSNLVKEILIDEELRSKINNIIKLNTNQSAELITIEVKVKKSANKPTK